MSKKSKLIHPNGHETGQRNRHHLCLLLHSHFAFGTAQTLPAPSCRVRCTIAHPSHRNLLVIILRVDLMPGCANLYTDSNICLWCATGTRGLKLRHIALEQLLPHPELLNLQAVTLDHLLDCLAPCLLLRKLGKLGQNPGSGSKFNVFGSTTLILMLGLDSTGRHK